ncbi:MAG: CoA ester lyase [Gammaproteobacteria bacterium]|nr:CoA ester lyase [Gammaproteobacteria bacterium]
MTKMQPSKGVRGLRRSLHFVPGGNDRMFEKALALPADSLILDLEDSVTPENKESAREHVCHWISETDFSKQECLVRINPQDTPWGRDDLAAIMEVLPDGLVLPKVASRAEVDAIDEMMTPVEQAHDVEAGSISLLLIGTEVPEAVFNLPEMTKNARVDAITWGAEDLSGALGAKAKRDEQGNYLEVFSYVRSTCLLAAVAGGAQPIDAVYVDIKNTAGLVRESKMAADMGFTGKITIHPTQIEIVNDAFTPSDAEISEAAELIQAFEEQQAAGNMAFSFKGQMVDVPHLTRARKILAIAAHIAGLTG